jgi:hypothetical protein
MIDMFRKKPVIEYESVNDYYPEPISPAKNHVPNWYKKIKKWENNEIFDSKNKKLNNSLKQCVPFLESMVTGYMITLPYDLYVEGDDQSCYLTWNVIDHPPTWRDNVSDPAVVPFNHHPTEYLWPYPLSHKIPKGYSLLLTHPLNRHDLPFTTLSGVVDGGDFIMIAGGNIPFYIKKGFKGKISQGTPIAQIIPFRNENWQSKKNNQLIKNGKIQNLASKSLLEGFYKNLHWRRKKYE